uniref:Bifunctional inhibitor/plant lipid transfer protein/seed storage helical domain-containing protein n=1 Tax=Nelumbo nucifera TaxID=4432 RepID=A0A822YE37_NELNU|nr:TPA_asm: hypothetical protein HUJ06_030977 [Nelumbo nucifera]
MGASSIRYLASAALILAGFLVSKHQVSAQDCQSDLHNLVIQCKQFVLKSGPKLPPSQGCCAVVKKADIPCVCKYITKEVEQFISVDKVVYVAQSCGKELPHGMKCGSVTIPLA